jgi:hypothetical protein
MTRWLFLIAAFLPALALGQAPVTITFPGNLTERSVGPGSCGEVVTVHWETKLTSGQLCPGGSSIRVWATTAASCPKEPVTDTDFEIGAKALASTTDSGDMTFEVNQLPGFTTELPCGGAFTKLWRICGAFEFAAILTTTCDQTAQSTEPAEVTYDGEPPGIPSLTLVALDGAVSVRGDAAGDPSAFLVEYRETGSTTEFADGGKHVVGGAAAHVSGLQNGVSYDFRARSEDLAGNVSEYSEVVSATPVASVGIYGLLAEQMGEKGGCASTGPQTLTLAATLSFAALAFSRRKGRGRK